MTGVPLRLRHRRPGPDRRAEGVPPLRRDGAAGVRPARLDRRLGDEEHVEAARASYARKRALFLDLFARAGVRVAGSGRRCTSGATCPGGRLRRRSRDGCSTAASSSRPAHISGRPARATSGSRSSRPGGVRARRRGSWKMSSDGELRRRIEECWEAGTPEPGPVEEAIALLDRGELRVAEPRDGGWVVNEWAKKAILLYFKLRKVEPMDAGPLHFLDKIPLKRDYAERGVESFRPGRTLRLVPVGVSC